MDIKINNTTTAMEDANTLISCANKLASIASTMRTLKTNFEDNWIEEGVQNQDRQRIVNSLGENIVFYETKIIPALKQLGNSINAYSTATEQIANSSIENPSLAGVTPSQWSDSQNTQTYKKGDGHTIDLTNIGYRDTSTTTYMNWGQKWMSGSNQKNFKEQATADQNVSCDSDGFYYVNDGTDNRYVVAMTQKYGDVGEYVDVYQADGGVLKCVIGDAKSYNDSNSGQYGHMYGGTVNVLEFMTNWSGKHANPGNVRTSLDQNILKVVNTGESYVFPKATWK